MSSNPVRAREHDTILEALVGLLYASRQKVGITQSAECARFVFSGSRFFGETPRSLVLGEAALDLAQRIVDVASHMMDSGQFQQVFALGRDHFGGAQLRKRFTMMIGDAQTSGQADTKNKLHTRAFGVAWQVGKRSQSFPAVRDRLLIGVTCPGAFSCLAPVRCRSFKLPRLHIVMREHFRG